MDLRYSLNVMPYMSCPSHMTKWGSSWPNLYIRQIMQLTWPISQTNILPHASVQISCKVKTTIKSIVSSHQEMPPPIQTYVNHSTTTFGGWASQEDDMDHKFSTDILFHQTKRPCLSTDQSVSTMSTIAHVPRSGRESFNSGEALLFYSNLSSMLKSSSQL